MTVFVCPRKDIVCGEIPANWCAECPRKHVMVPVAPHAAAGPYPTAMRPATAQEHQWLMAAGGNRVKDPGAMWDRFIAAHAARLGVQVKNLIGGADAMREEFINANRERS